VSDRHRRVRELFLRARSLPAQERESWLETACPDAAVRADVASLLAAEEGMPSGYLTPRLGPDLSPGARLGRYSMIEPLGSGGMGEVWLARDDDLERPVAIKFPLERALGPSLRRVRREARAAAVLEHPAVCRVHELGEAAGRPFIVMEYLQGETLAERLGRGRVPVDRALAWGAAIAGALEEAHEKGLLHLDLKPANVMVTRSGEVKVMDFGLARVAHSAAEPAHLSGSDPGPVPAPGSDPGPILAPDPGPVAAPGSPTDSDAPAMAGTPPYMAPELLRGRPPDARSDIWSFGCVLYEMLAGRRAFEGDTPAEAVARVLERDPGWEALPAEVPPEVRRLLGRCLRKDPAQRLRHVGDACLVLEEAVRDEPPPGTQPQVVRKERRPGTPATTSLEPAQAWWRKRSARVAVVALLAVTAALAGWRATRPGATAGGGSVHATVTLPSGVRVARAGAIASSVAISPDGRTLVAAATDAEGQRLYLRPLDRPEAVPLPGTENGLGPFFSPDGAWIGFFADGRLRRVPAGGGAAVDIAAAPGLPLGASWGVDDRIVFSAGTRSPLYVVPARGGLPEPLTALDPEAGEVSHRHPELLPDGRTVLFTSLSPAGWSVHAFDLRSGLRAELAEGATPRYVTDGHVVLNRGTDLLAAPFDAGRLELAGALAPVAEDVAAEMGGSMHYGLSREGTLVYVPAPADARLVVIEDGEERVVDAGFLVYPRPPRPRFSPDGSRLALTAGRTADVWIHDLADEASSRLTFQGGSAPVWTPDGRGVTFAASPFLGTGAHRRGLHTKPVDGSSDAGELLAFEEWHRPIGWTPDGRMLAFEAVRVDGPPSIWVLADGDARPIVQQAYAGRLSPDGRWLAYHSEESGGAEVYVTPFPDTDARWQISADGGTGPAWSPDGTEVYYRSGDRLVAARIETTDGVRVTSRRVVLEPFAPAWPDDYDLRPDGRAVALVRPVADHPANGTIGIVVNWSAELPR
jgi:eukaryotic-like serine/threonine-protein kinase